MDCTITVYMEESLEIAKFSPLVRLHHKFYLIAVACHHMHVPRNVGNLSDSGHQPSGYP